MHSNVCRYVSEIFCDIEGNMQIGKCHFLPRRVHGNVFLSLSFSALFAGPTTPSLQRTYREIRAQRPNRGIEWKDDGQHKANNDETNRVQEILLFTQYGQL